MNWWLILGVVMIVLAGVVGVTLAAFSTFAGATFLGGFIYGVALMLVAYLSGKNHGD